MNLKLTVAVLVITAVPVFAQAQKPNAVIVTHLMKSSNSSQAEPGPMSAIGT